MQLKRMVCGAIGVLGLASPGVAQAPPPARTVLFQNVRVFDGRSTALTAPPATCRCAGSRAPATWAGR